jgi:hypothetical protein
MATPIFGYNNFVDLAATTLSGGSYETTLPLANIQDRRLAKVARTTDATTANTQFDVDLGAARVVRAIHLTGMNLSLSATIRVRGYTGAGHTSEVFDTGALNPFEVYPSGVLEAGHPAYGTTTLALEDWTAGYPVNFTNVRSSPESPRYIWVTVIDTGNADGYVEFGRCWITYGYKPSHGISTGARFGYQTESRRRVTDGGAAFYNDRPRRRQFDFTLSQFGDDESLVYLLELERRVGTTQQMLFIGDSAAGVHMHRWAFPCTLERLNPLSMSRSLWNDHGFSLIEEL